MAMGRLVKSPMRIDPMAVTAEVAVTMSFWTTVGVSNRPQRRAQPPLTKHAELVLVRRKIVGVADMALDAGAACLRQYGRL